MTHSILVQLGQTSQGAHPAPVNRSRLGEASRQLGFQTFQCMPPHLGTELLARGQVPSPALVIILAHLIGLFASVLGLWQEEHSGSGRKSSKGGKASQKEEVPQGRGPKPREGTGSF